MALYNKYRPRNLRQVCGQEHVKNILANQAKNDSFSHSYLFVGPAGTGKTTVARILSAMVNCSTGPCIMPSPDDPHVKEIFSASNQSDVIELDAATNSSVNNIREMRDSMQLAPMMMRKKIYIMDECHRFSTEAWEALLKTIEEPPSHLMFIFATTDDDKVPETIKTRCMCLDFKHLSPKDISAHLAVICQCEKIKADQEAIDLISASCDGGLRRALSYLEAVLAQGSITVDSTKSLLGLTSSKCLREFLRTIATHSFADAMKISSESLSSGVDVEGFLIGLAEQFYYSVMVVTSGFDASFLPEEDRKGAREIFDQFAEALGDKTEPRNETRRAIRRLIHIVQETHKMTVFRIHPQHWINYTWLFLSQEISSIKEKR